MFWMFVWWNLSFHQGFYPNERKGTRKHNFYSNWIDKNNLPPLQNPDKEIFKLFDFFGNCEYFEDKFDYDEVLKLPSLSSSSKGGGKTVIHFDEYENINPDPLKTLKEIKVGEKGMRIDREAFEKFKEISIKDERVLELHKERDWDSLEDYMVKNIFDKPTEYFNLDKLRNTLGVDRRISVKELIDYTLGLALYQIKHGLLEEEYEKFDDRYLPNEENFST